MPELPSGCTCPPGRFEVECFTHGRIGLGVAEPAGAASPTGEDAAPGSCALFKCIPEWCELQAEPHDDTCPEHKVDLTKAEFVAAAEGGARAAIETYLFCIGDMTHDEAVEMVEVEAQEAATCFVGIGSCGRGWCKHS